VNEGGDHPGRIGPGIGVHDGCGMEAPDAPCRLDLAREPLTELLVAGVPGMDDLHRDLAATGGQAEEHLSHPAFAQSPDQPVVTDPVRITRA
jgi:hypothetical protein